MSIWPLKIYIACYVETTFMIQMTKYTCFDTHL